MKRAAAPATSLLPALAAALFLAASSAPATANEVGWVALSPADPSPQDRFGAAAAYLPEADAVVVLGGERASGFHADGWLWDGDDWTPWDDALLGPRTGLALVYDPDREELLAFGGRQRQSGGPLLTLGDTWIFSSGEWSQSNPSPAPAARANAAIAYDPRGERVVLFGGEDPLERPDTWIWENQAWRELPELGPSARGGSALGYDGDSGTLILFGGVYGIVEQGDTWELDGDTWRQLTPATVPPARYGHNMVTDGRGRLYMFGGAYLEQPGGGGIDQEFFRADLWQFVDGDWLALPADERASPTARAYAAATFDPDRRRVVVMGGRDHVGSRHDVWELALPRSHYGCAASPVEAGGSEVTSVALLLSLLCGRVAFSRRRRATRLRR